MGQKINPNSIRLLINPNYSSAWYEDKKNYSQLAKEDHFARTTIKNLFDKFIFISNIKILRINSLNTCKTEKTNLCINLFFPTWKEIINILKLGMESNHIIAKEYTKRLKIKTLKKLFIFFILEQSHFLAKKMSIQFKKRYLINFFFIKNRFKHPKLIAFYIATLIKQNMRIKRIMKEILRRLKNVEGIKGAQISISGCISKSDRARTEYIKHGVLPFNTFKSNIYFAHESLKTSRGIYGINVALNVC